MSESGTKTGWTGMSDDEAMEFHQFYMQGLIGFTVIAVVAHFLVWMWRPWIPGDAGYSAVIDGANTAITSIAPLVA